MIELSFNFEFESIGTNLEAKLQDALKTSAYLIENTAKRSIQRSPATGRIYKRRSIKHTASSPGNPPRNDSGRLWNSIRSNFSNLTSETGSDVLYSLFLENGTNKMKARPWLMPSYEQNKKEIERLFNQAINEVLK